MGLWKINKKLQVCFISLKKIKSKFLKFSFIASEYQVHSVLILLSILIHTFKIISLKNKTKNILVYAKAQKAMNNVLRKLKGELTQSPHPMMNWTRRSSRTFLSLTSTDSQRAISCLHLCCSMINSNNIDNLYSFLFFVLFDNLHSQRVYFPKKQNALQLRVHLFYTANRGKYYPILQMKKLRHTRVVFVEKLSPRGLVKSYLPNYNEVSG